jgi:hypothetical protein
VKVKPSRLGRATAIVVAVLLSGCSTYAAARSPAVPDVTQPGMSSVLNVPRAQPTVATAWPVPRRAASDALLWATDQLDSTVTAFDLEEPGAPAVATITDGIDNPRGVSIDSHGTLYVANAGSGNVTEYPLGQTSPSVTLSGLSAPNDIAFNPNGDVYVSNTGTPASIVVYKPGKTKPYRYIVGRHIQVPWQIFFDSAGDLYMADDVTGVSVMKHGTSRFRSLRLRRLGMLPRALAQDPVNGDLYLGDGANSPSGHFSARVYRPGGRAPAYHLPVTIGVHAIAVGPVRGDIDVFVATYGPDDPIYVFHHHRRKPVEVISNTLLGINGVALQPAGLR